MRTVLSQFCEEFEEAVRPLLQPLQQASGTLEIASETVPARQILPGLRDLRHQLQTLAEKVAGQQAYCLIFGPLKSGKSTLMNAMSSAYVSEVTSLPAYPCLVNVNHSESKEFVVTRYNGEATTYHDITAMRMELQRAHGELAGRIRDVESQGEEFDPGVHFPQAIRRVDVRVPAGHLEQSGAVLVDTPGLYTRMKFGYDRMTREFRDTAACAIFVVKTDNLFLEQVFHEFHQLLELFSRIFLVVNLDSGKQDLRPDGSLVPSLEHDDPIRIIQAFENLAMSAPLKAALDEGRLRLYPVDLLRAASERLKLDAAGEGAADEATTVETEARQADFDQFLTDLTDYLNSTDYLVAFLGDSLRHAGSLLTELRDLCADPAVQELAAEVGRLEHERSAAKQKLDTLQRLEGFSWDEAFRPLGDQLAESVQEQSTAIREKTERALMGSLDSWFRNDSSLKDFCDREAGPLLASCQNELALSIHQSLSSLLSPGQAGPAVPSGVRVSLTAAGVDLDAISRSAQEGIDPYAGIEPATVRLDASTVPVKKGFWDWIFFRSQNAIARRIFGPSQAPANRIAKTVKARRLGDAAKKALQTAVDDAFEQFFPMALDRLVSRIYADYAGPATEGVKADLSARREESRDRLAAAEGRLAETQRVRDELAELETTLGTTESTLEALAGRYGETDPWLLKQAVEDEGEAEAAEETDAEVEQEEIKLGEE